MQTCSTSSTQSLIEFNAYNNGSDKYALQEVLIDSSMNKYILHAPEGDQVAPHIAKMLPDGTYSWTKTYSNLQIGHQAKLMTLSGDENTIRMITGAYNADPKFTQISTSNVY